MEKKPSETNDFLDRKLKIVDANSENITKAVAATRYVKCVGNIMLVRAHLLPPRNIDMNPLNQLSHDIVVLELESFCRQNLESIAMSMQGKMLEIRARQEGQRHRASAEGGN